MDKKDFDAIMPIFNEKRIKILENLFRCKETICGCDLVDRIGIPKNLLSYHIKFLVNEGMIEEKRCGQRKNYILSKKGEKIIVNFLKIKKIMQN